MHKRAPPKPLSRERSLKTWVSEAQSSCAYLKHENTVKAVESLSSDYRPKKLWLSPVQSHKTSPNPMHTSNSILPSYGSPFHYFWSNNASAPDSSMCSELELCCCPPAADLLYLICFKNRNSGRGACPHSGVRFYRISWSTKIGKGLETHFTDGCTSSLSIAVQQQDEGRLVVRERYHDYVALTHKLSFWSERKTTGLDFGYGRPQPSSSPFR